MRTIQLSMGDVPERPGFWSAGKGEFEQTWNLLEGLITQENGFPIEVMDQIRTDHRFAENLARFIVNGGVMPSEEEILAQTTGIKVITQGQVFRVLTWITNYLSRNEWHGTPPKIPFSDKLLRKYAKTHVLLPGPPLPQSLKNMEKLLPSWQEAKNGDGPYWIRDDWRMGTREADFYNYEKMEPGWHLIGMVPLNKTSNTKPAQMSSLIPEGEKIPRACEIVYMAIMWNYVMHTSLFPNDNFTFVTASKDGLGPVGVSGARCDWQGWPYTSVGCTCPHPQVMAVTSVIPDLQ